MSRSNKLIFALMVSASLALTGCFGGDGDGKKGPKTVSVSGKVVQSDGMTAALSDKSNRTASISKVGGGSYTLAEMAVANADVTFEKTPIPPGTPSYNTLTNSKGEFTVDEVEVGTYNLEVRSTDPGEVFWTRAVVEINNEGDVGTFPVDAGPYFERAFVDGNEYAIEFGKRTMKIEHSAHFAAGTTVSFDVELIDPNDRNVTVSIPYNDMEDGGAPKMAEIPAVQEEGNPVQTVPVTITLDNNHYVITIGDFIKREIPHMIAGRTDMFPECFLRNYDTCQGIPNFAWNDVEKILLVLPVNNGDGHGSLDGRNDGEVFIEITNTGYDFVPNTDTPVINSVTVNGVTYPNPGDGSYTVDLGYIGDQTALDISVDMTTNGTAPVTQYFVVPGLGMAGSGSTEYLVEVADLPKVYAVTPYPQRTRVMFEAMYEGVETKAQVEIRYDISGDAEPAECTSIAVNGSTDFSNTLFSVGQTIDIQIGTADPNGLPVEVAVERRGAGIPVHEAFITGWNFETSRPMYVPAGTVISYTFQPEDNVDNLQLIAFCRNNDGVGISDTDSEDHFISAPVKVSN